MGMQLCPGCCTSAIARSRAIAGCTLSIVFFACGLKTLGVIINKAKNRSNFCPTVGKKYAESLENDPDIQEIDMQMIQLMRLKKERQNDLDKINAVKNDLRHQAKTKQAEIEDLKKLIRLMEGELDRGQSQDQKA